MRLHLVLAATCRAWHRWLSPALPPACRFAPSCSSYAADAFALHGVVRGGGLAVARIMRCHPWHPGGYDPVPAAVAPRERVGREETVSG